jgi:O-antigen ligase
MIQHQNLKQPVSLLQKSEGVFLFCTILLLPTQLGKHFWPTFAYVFSLPIDYLSPTLFVWDILVFIYLIFRFYSIWHEDILSRLRTPLSVLLIFLLSQLVSIMWNQTYGVGLVRLWEYGLIGLWAVMLGTYDFKVLIKNIQLPMFVSFMFEVSLGFSQTLLGHSLGFWILGERTFSITTPAIAKFNIYGFEYLRPYGTFPHPNVLSAYVSITTYLLWSISSLSHWKKLVSLLSGGILVTMSVSRAVVTGGILLMLARLNKNQRIWFTLFCILLSPFLYIRFSSLFSYDLLSLTRREDLFYIGWSVFCQSPIFGVGLNNFIPTIAYSTPVTGFSRFLQPVHNIYLLALAETGLVGLVGLLLFIAYPIYRLWKVKRTLMSQSLFFIWPLILFLGLFDHYFLTLPQGMRLVGLLWGLSVSATQSKS